LTTKFADSSSALWLNICATEDRSGFKGQFVGPAKEGGYQLQLALNHEQLG
jgi:hypothetical protein